MTPPPRSLFEVIEDQKREISRLKHRYVELLQVFKKLRSAVKVQKEVLQLFFCYCGPGTPAQVSAPCVMCKGHEEGFYAWLERETVNE